MTHELPLTFRLSREEDLPLIYDSWLRSSKATYCPFGKSSEVRRYCRGVHLWVDKVLEQGYVYMACNPDDTKLVFGWCAVQPTNAGPILHYVYVKKAYRGLKVCSRLLAAARWNPGACALASCSSKAFEACYNGRFADISLGGS